MGPTSHRGLSKHSWKFEGQVARTVSKKEKEHVSIAPPSISRRATPTKVLCNHWPKKEMIRIQLSWHCLKIILGKKSIGTSYGGPRAERNLITSQVVEGIPIPKPDVSFTKSDWHHMYRGVSGEMCINWKQKDYLNVYLRIRHWSGLLLRITKGNSINCSSILWIAFL